GYRYLKPSYANEPITLPRERLDLLQANDYATILFKVTHPNYHYNVFTRGFAPTDADAPIYVPFTVKPFAEQMNKVAGWAEGPKQDMQKFAPDSREFKIADIRYRQARVNLGLLIGRLITVSTSV
ncbi:hypothetical protein CWB79_22900, partial [Pseudoalteromonas sp. S1649]